MTAQARVGARLASAAGRRDEALNIALAEELCRQGDRDGIADLAEIVRGGDRAARHDAIKVLYEIGARDPRLLHGHTELFLKEMQSRDNRMVWGALTALAALARVDARSITANLDAILSAADAGSVIAKDQAVQILIALTSTPDSAQAATAHLFERLRIAAINQLPMYAERIAAVIGPDERAKFRAILTERLTEDMPASKRRRIERVIAR